ncbi:MAG: hypothetical protein GEV11_16885 [Streptosporangiales bacterium]|nr:hypothetical protein [Streptosporangiales bacterium]
MELVSRQSSDGPPVPSARISVDGDSLVAHGWREVVRLPRTGLGAVRTIGTYRYETRSWSGPRAGYTGRVYEGLVLLDEFGGVALDIPGHWADEDLTAFAGEYGLRLATDPVRPRALNAVRRLRLVPHRKMTWDDGCTLVIAAALLGGILGWLAFGRESVPTMAFWFGVVVLGLWVGTRIYSRARYRAWLRNGHDSE